ncbi:MAG: glycosyltransferase family 2 protein [Cyclobacteriaceae bacterium]
MKLSVLIITYNEEKHIAKCLKSVQKIADEIIVVDSYSDDKTVDICKEFGVRLIQRAYPGQVEQKQFALSQAAFPMVLSIDGDEELNDELLKAISREKDKSFPLSGYYFRRKAFYQGAWVNFGDWSSEWKLRLWKKDAANWVGPNPHDKVILDNKNNSKKLSGLLHHFTFETLDEHICQVHKYAKISGRSNLNRGRRFPFLRMVASPLVYFLKSYILKGGFLDGKRGWHIAMLSMLEKFLKYRIQMQLRNTNSLN